MTGGRARHARRVRAAAVGAVALAVLAGCSGGEVDRERDPDDKTSEVSPEPQVREIADAIAAVEAWYGAPQEYFEISANLQQVSLIVAADGGESAEQAFYVRDELVTPASIDEWPPYTFTADQVDFDPDTIFDGVREELDYPVLIDFAITATSTGNVLYDTTIASDKGGVLLVLLGPDGTVEGVQAS